MISAHKSTFFVFSLAWAFLIGALILWNPIVAVCTVVVFLLVTSGMKGSSYLERFYLLSLGSCLTGYAFLGKGFAYIGFFPIFVGEIILFVGLFSYLFSGQPSALLRLPFARILLLFVAWGALRTFPFIGVYGIDSLRDGAAWGYSAFAFFASLALLHTNSISRVPYLYGRLLPWYLLWLPCAYTIGSFLLDEMPQLPSSPVPLLALKQGDVSVHLAGIGAFLLLRPERSSLSSRRGPWLKEYLYWLVWLADFLLSGSMSRGGLLSVFVAGLVVMIFRPLRRWGKLLFVFVLLATLSLFFNPKIDLGFSRIISPQQIIINLKSVFGSTSPDLQGTKEWRLNWWRDIADYTVFGEYFWTGKGYGINLADIDGYQAGEGLPLRSPHNSHLTFLARSGVPGFAIWAALQLGFAYSLIRALLKARKRNLLTWARIDLWVLAYWSAFIVNGAFDVFLEGPQGGIWFWSLFGFGISVLAYQSRVMRNGLLPEAEHGKSENPI